MTKNNKRKLADIILMTCGTFLIVSESIFAYRSFVEGDVLRGVLFTILASSLFISNCLGIVFDRYDRIENKSEDKE